MNGISDHSTTDLHRSVSDLLDGRKPSTRVLGLGEPTHGDDTFLALRNDLLEHLIAHEGFVAVVLETEAGAAALLDDYVRGHRDDLDVVLADGFSHGFGQYPGNRDLLERLRRINAGRSAADAVRCLGFDAAMEQTAEDYRDPERAARRMTERAMRMTDRLVAIIDEESGRGRILVHAHHTHLHRIGSTMRLGPNEIAWDPPGVALGRRDDYAVLLTSCGASPARGVPAAPDGTLEARLATLDTSPVLLTRDELADLIAAAPAPLRARDDLTPAMALAPLDPDTVLDEADGVIHTVVGHAGPTLTADDCVRLLGALPDVVIETAGPATGAPETAWGDSFATVQPSGRHEPARMPFATVVISDYPGFDEASALDRDGVFALNLGVGRELFSGLLGFAPAQAADHAHRFDPAAAGVLMPHPVYAAQGWVRVLNPPAAQRVQLVALATEAARRRRPRGH